jgi:hypothetical protein
MVMSQQRKQNALIVTSNRGKASLPQTAEVADDTRFKYVNKLLEENKHQFISGMPNTAGH